MVFDIFVDHAMMMRAQTSVPPGCGVSIHLNGREPLPAGQLGPLERAVMLVHADGVVLQSPTRRSWPHVAAVDQVAHEYGVCQRCRGKDPGGQRRPVASLEVQRAG